jgi:hypothetical protein
MMPWFWILILIGSLYLAVKLAQAAVEFISWYKEGRDFDREQKRLRELRRQGHTANPPPLKERPENPKTPPASQRKGPGHK